MYPEPAGEQDWEAQSDARTLAEADIIKKDAKRMTAAEKAAVVMAEKQKDEAVALAKIGSGQLSYPKSDM